MSALKRKWLQRRAAYGSLALYIAIDFLTSFHNWLLEISDTYLALTWFDYLKFIVGAVLSALLMVKALQSTTWHETTPVPNTPTISQNEHAQ